MKASMMSVAASAMMLAVAGVTAVQAQAPGAPEMLRLVNGTTLMGRVISSDSGKVRVMVDGIGQIVVDSAAVQSRAPIPAPPRPAAPPSPWSGSASAAFALRSAILPGVAETSFGLELKVAVVRALHSGALMLNGSLGYLRNKPDPAGTNEWMLAVGWRHTLSKRWVGLGRTLIGANRVQEIRFRSTTFVGAGPYLVKNARVSLLVAPGVGYLKVTQTQRGSVLAFAAGEPSGAAGVVLGAHDMLMVQLGPMLSLQQNALWLHRAGSFGSSQLQLETRVTGMVTKHLGMLIVFNQQYDSSMPTPVKKTVRSLNSGVQVQF